MTVSELKGGPLAMSSDVAMLFVAQIAVTCADTNADAHRKAKMLDDVLARLTPKDKADAALVARAVLRYCTQ